MNNLYDEVFIMIDQPTTCPYCGSRTEIIADFIHTNLKAQVHQCPTKSCAVVFVEEEDDFFETK